MNCYSVYIMLLKYFLYIYCVSHTFLPPFILNYNIYVINKNFDVSSLYSHIKTADAETPANKTLLFFEITITNRVTSISAL